MFFGCGLKLQPLDLIQANLRDAWGTLTVYLDK